VKAATIADKFLPRILSGQPFATPSRRNTYHRGPLIIHISARKLRENGPNRGPNTKRGTSAVYGIADLHAVARPDAIVSDPDTPTWVDQFDGPHINPTVLTELAVTDDEYIWLFGPCILRSDGPVIWPGERALLWDHPAAGLCPTCGEFIEEPADWDKYFDDMHTWPHLPTDLRTILTDAKRIA